MQEAVEMTSGEDPGRSAESSEREKAVREAIALLPPDLRESLILGEYERLSHAEIAAIAGCSAKAVERRISRAREILRRELSRYLKG
jgi:RNA polymerase sigma-70 factor (ECF subfamily)